MDKYIEGITNTCNDDFKMKRVKNAKEYENLKEQKIFIYGQK